MVFCPRTVLPEHAARLRALLLHPSPDRELFCPFLVVATYANSKDSFNLSESAGLEERPLFVRRSVLGHFCGEPTNTARRTSSRCADVADSIAHMVAQAPKTGLEALRAIAVKELQEVPTASMLKRAKRIVLRRLLDDGYTTSAAQAAFADPEQTAAVDTANLEPSQEFLTPPDNVPPERPSKKRKPEPGQNESVQDGKKRSRKVSRCAACGYEGHNLRTCPLLPKL